jgi:hypothetical protein
LPSVAATSYGTKPRAVTPEVIGRRYLVVSIRALVNPADPEEVRNVHALQDAIKVSQKSPAKLDIPNGIRQARKRWATGSPGA